MTPTKKAFLLSPVKRLFYLAIFTRAKISFHFILTHPEIHLTKFTSKPRGVNSLVNVEFSELPVSVF